jgi:hypothetical protein
MNQAQHTPVETLIHLIRGQKVMLDHDLARLYGVETKSSKPSRKAPYQNDFQQTLCSNSAEIEAESLLGGHNL